MKPKHHEIMAAIGTVYPKLRKIPAWIRKAVIALEQDISDRRGLKWEWGRIDDDTKAEIRKAWAAIIAASYAEAAQRRVAELEAEGRGRG